MTYARLPPRTTAARWNDTDNLLAGILRRHPDGLTRGEIARLLGRRYDAIESALYRLEGRGVLLCEDRGRISIYQDTPC